MVGRKEQVPAVLTAQQRADEMDARRVRTMVACSVESSAAMRVVMTALQSVVDWAERMAGSKDNPQVARRVGTTVGQ